MSISRPVSIRINSVGLRWNCVYCPADAITAIPPHLYNIRSWSIKPAMRWWWWWWCWPDPELCVCVSVCKILFGVRLSFSIMLGPLIRNRHNRNNEHHWFTLSMPISDHNEYSSAFLLLFFFSCWIPFYLQVFSFRVVPLRADRFV